MLQRSALIITLLIAGHALAERPRVVVVKSAALIAYAAGWLKQHEGGR